MGRTLYVEPRYVARRRYGFLHFLLDLFLTVITHGLWLLWLLFKYLRTH